VRDKNSLRTKDPIKEVDEYSRLCPKPAKGQPNLLDPFPLIEISLLFGRGISNLSQFLYNKIIKSVGIFESEEDIFN